MKTLRKFRKNAKALSPVVASIILIAVTVAVSIAVAAWMGALTVGFMSTEEVKITSMTCTVGTPGTIVLKVANTGTSASTISEVWVNNVDQTSNAVFSGDATATIDGNAQKSLTISLQVDAGYSYQVKLISAQGNTFTYTGVAPN